MGRKNKRASDEAVLSRKERRAAKLAAERYAIVSNNGQMPKWMLEYENSAAQAGQHTDGTWYLLFK